MDIYVVIYIAQLPSLFLMYHLQKHTFDNTATQLYISTSICYMFGLLTVLLLIQCTVSLMKTDELK